MVALAVEPLKVKRCKRWDDEEGAERHEAREELKRRDAKRRRERDNKRREREFGY